MPPTPGDPKAEIARLRAKLATIQDHDIRAAIQERVEALASQVIDEPSLLPSGGEGPGVRGPELLQEPPPPPTPEQAEQAERLIRHAMLEKQRGNKARVTELLQEAVAVAPNAPATLEALGDDLASRSRAKEALDAYKRAMELDPKNVGLAKKHANLVFNVGAAGSLEDQMRANLSESIFLSRSDAVASYGVAKLLSYPFPGLGHVLLGRPVFGFSLLAAWIGCFVWMGLAHSAQPPGSKVGSEVYFPAFLAIVVLIVGVATLGSDRTAARTKVAPKRPKPPVDLPFD